MGDCIYCGKPAGIFRSRHKECQVAEESRIEASRALIELAESTLSKGALLALSGGMDVSELLTVIDAASGENGLSQSVVRKILVSSWEAALNESLEDGVFDETEQGRLISYLEKLGITSDEVNETGAFSRLVKGVVIRELLSGIIPDRFNFTSPLPINLQKGEKIVWAFTNTAYLEDRVRRERVGGSQGVSVRIMKGLYYRAGAFKSIPVETTERKHIDTGTLFVTSKNLYFSSPAKSMRIPYEKIVSFDPYSDGIGIMRDALTAKPQIFITDDGWFTYNLVTNLAQI